MWNHQFVKIFLADQLSLCGDITRLELDLNAYTDVHVQRLLDAVRQQLWTSVQEKGKEVGAEQLLRGGVYSLPVRLSVQQEVFQPGEREERG